MPFNTFTVATAVTPSVIETYVSHYIFRGPLRQKPSAHISYHEGLKIVRQFLEYASKHTVEDIQAFTSQWVPAPTWVRTQDVEVPPQFLERAAKVLRYELGTHGIHKVGGETWWQWRRPDSALHAEWIEMKKDYLERKRAGVKCDRVILYVHGGAYYFGSVDEHRYQMQRHARKLKARVLAPRYRLAPQFPFPCGLYDCIATYFYLLEHFDPTQILFAGDSAGGGMVLSMLVTLRDQGCPLPAGTMLLSPWVDLTHSFPSVAGDGDGDYIPPHGFLHKPSMSWPPPRPEKKERVFTQPVEQPYDVVELPANPGLGMKAVRSMQRSVDDLHAEAEAETKKKKHQIPLNSVPGMTPKLEITIDGKVVEIDDQIQLYARNELLVHPLVSPVQQPSLGGLPPMLIQVGGAELLRDEQIYLAHKAANPRAYPPSDAILDEYDPQRTIYNRYPPTDVQLQVWEDLCHVPHTLSFTRPAKYMYRSVAQFGAWALAHAQQKDIEIQDDDDVSVISSGSENGSVTESTLDLPRQKTSGSIGIDGVKSTQYNLAPVGAVGRAGDQLPPFKDHMIRQRVNRHGIIFPLAVQSEIASLHLDPATIGAIKPGPVRKWLNRNAEHTLKYASRAKKVEKKRAKEAANGYDRIKGEDPPPSALVNRVSRGAAPEAKKKKKSWGLAMWAGWGSSHDQTTLEREEKAIEDEAKDAQTESSVSGGFGRRSSTNLAVPVSKDRNTTRPARSASAASMFQSNRNDNRPKSPYRMVADAGQVESDRTSAVSPVDDREDPLAGGSMSRSTTGISGRSIPNSSGVTFTSRPISMAAPIPVDTLGVDGQRRTPGMSDTGKEAVKVPGSENTYLTPSSSRPHNGTVAYPFKLKQGQNPAGIAASPNPSTQTLVGSISPSIAAGGGPSGEPRVAPVSAFVSEMAAGEVAATELPAGNDAAGRGSDSNPAELSSVSVGRRTANGSLPPSPVDAPREASRAPWAAQRAPADDISPSSLEPPRANYGRLESRDSRIGNLGADGMPIAAFPGPGRPPPPVPAGVSSSASNGDQELVSPVDDANKAPLFKVRNPVFDSRAETAPSSVPAAATPPQATPREVARDSEGKPAPFKLRHTIYDPTFFGSKPPAGASASPTASRRNSTTSSSDVSSVATADQPLDGAPSEYPMPSSMPHNANVTMPTVVTRRPLPQVFPPGDDVPPTPPPKDDDFVPLRSGGTAEDAPAKKERPPMETFVTAREDLELNGGEA